MRKKRKLSIAYGIVFFALLAAGLLLISNGDSAEIAESSLPSSLPSCIITTHAHADFLVVIDGEPVNFSKPEYDNANPFIRLQTKNHGGDKVLHIESRETNLDDFFESLNMTFSSECFVLDDAYCNNETHTIKFFVNGEKSDRFEKYLPKDLDRILVIYGNETDEEIKGWAEKVTSLACIFSFKCEPPEEADDKMFYN